MPCSLVAGKLSAEGVINEASGFPEIGGGRRRWQHASRTRRVVSCQGPVAPGNPADHLRERPQQRRHPRHRHQRAGLRGVVELLRPAHQPRDEDAAERRPVLRPRQVQDGAGRGHERRRHVRHVQAAQGRQVPGRHAGHRQGREVVARPRRHRRRLPHLPDGRRLDDQGRAVRGGRRSHRARRLPEEGPPDHPRSRGHRALHHQLRAGEEERHRQGPLGARVHQAEHLRQRRLQAHQMDARAPR